MTNTRSTLKILLLIECLGKERLNAFFFLEGLLLVSTSLGHYNTMDVESLRKLYRDIIEPDGKPNVAMRQALKLSHLTPKQALRKLILQYGIPEDDDPDHIIHQQCRCTTRGLVWKALLGVREVSADTYIALVRMGQSSFFAKINGDVDRTFRGEELFEQVVPIDARTRILNAFANDVAGLQCCFLPFTFSPLHLILGFRLFT